jgi:hypothetical protein
LCGRKEQQSALAKRQKELGNKTALGITAVVTLLSARQVFIQDRAESVLVVAKPQTVFSGEPPDLNFTFLAVDWPDTR